MGSRIIWSTWQFATESINWKHLISIIVLKDLANRVNCICVLIPWLGIELIKIMERLSLIRCPIGKSVIYGHVYPDFTAPKNVVKECDPVLYNHVLQCKPSTFQLHIQSFASI